MKSRIRTLCRLSSQIQRHVVVRNYVSAAAASPAAATAARAVSGSTVGPQYGLSKPTHPDSRTHPDTLSRIQADSKVLLDLYARPPLIFTHGQGCYLFDKAGRQYLDLGSGIAVNAVGHNDPDVVEAIRDQAGKLIHLSNLYHNEWAGELGRLLVCAVGEKGKFEGGAKVFLCNSGTEANEGAIKFGRKWGKVYLETSTSPTKPTEKHTIVSFTNAFHGRSLGALSATPSPKYQAPFSPLLPGFVHAPLNDVEKMREVVDERVCAVMVEPIQGEGGIWEVKKEFLEALRERCDEVGALLVFDEIQAGLGRTGKPFAYQHHPTVTPDILTLAKPLANGIPSGAVILSPTVASIIKPGDHGTTFGGSPFASRVAVTTLQKILTPSFLSHVSEVGSYFKSALEELAASTPIITQVRGRGLMLGLQLRESVEPKMFVDLARERGVLVIAAGCNTIRVVPPLIITREEVDKGVEVLEDVVGVMEGLIAAGRDVKS
ncbi:acetylornithine aminotransferase [Quaeritorhiza haematococci]|nr:acetylornithine aminotransferase [Quaeritorhiza haematococci]